MALGIVNRIFESGDGGLSLWRMVAVFVPLTGVSVLLMANLLPPTFASNKAAVAATGECGWAVGLLGEPVEMNPLGFAWGTSSPEDVENFARWTLPVRGDRGSGRLFYIGEQERGQWRVAYATLEVGDDVLGVVPCRGPIDPMDARGELQQGFRGTGVVESVSGPAPAAAGEVCSIEVFPQTRLYPEQSPYNCRVEIVCGDRVLYGDSDTQGYVHCTPSSGAPVGAVDSFGAEVSGDPLMRLDLEAGVAEIWDEPDRRRFSVTVRLDGG